MGFAMGRKKNIQQFLKGKISFRNNGTAAMEKSKWNEFSHNVFLWNLIKTWEAKEAIREKIVQRNLEHSVHTYTMDHLVTKQYHVLRSNLFEAFSWLAETF